MAQQDREREIDRGGESRLELAFPKRGQGGRQDEQNCPQAAEQESCEASERRRRVRADSECKQEANKWNLITKSSARSETRQKHSTKRNEIKRNKTKQNETK